MARSLRLRSITPRRRRAPWLLPALLAACDGSGGLGGTDDLGAAVSADLMPVAPPEDLASAGASDLVTATPADLAGSSRADLAAAAPDLVRSGMVGPVGCVKTVKAGHQVVDCGGIKYDVDVSPACALGDCGLVLDMHGFTMNAGQEDAGTGMRALGNKHGYVVVQPNAPGIPAGWDQARHVPLVFAFVRDVATAFATDARRAHAMGFSQGGGMTWRMICDHADFFASAAPLAGVHGCEFAPPNAPSREVPTLQLHGHKDRILAFDAYAIPDRAAALAFWKHGAGMKFQGDATHTATRYLTAAGTPLEFWEHDYSAGSGILGGHCFPGGTDKGISPLQFGCTEAGAFSIGELAMQFFRDHPMK